MSTNANHHPDEFNLFRAGSVLALKFFFLLWHEPLFLYIYRMCNNIDLAKDCTSYAFNVIWERRAFIFNERQLRGALYVIARNKLFREKKGDQRREKLAEEAQTFIESYTIQNDDEVVKLQALDLLDQELKRLPRQQEIVLRMIFLEEYTTKEVADELGLDPQTVLNHKARGLDKLRKRLPGLEYWLLLLEFFLKK